MKNYVYKLIGEFGVRLLSAVFLLLMARAVGAADFGVYSTAFAFAAVFAILIDLGTNPLVTREIARHPDKQTHIIASVNLLKLAASLVMLLCLHAAVRAFGFTEEKTRLIDWLGWVVVATAFTEYLSAIFTGREEMRTEAIIKIVGKGVVIAAALIALINTKSVYPTVKTMGIFSIVSLFVAAVLTRYRLGTFGLSFDWSYLRGLLRQAAPLFGALAFLIMYGSQGILLLNVYNVSDDDIGQFALAIKIIDVIKVLPVLLASTFLPSLARHARLSKQAFEQRARELLRYAVWIFPLLVGTLLALAPGLLDILYGHAYRETIPALRWLLAAFLIMAFNLILLHVLIALDQNKQAFFGQALTSLSHLGASMLFIPRYGMIGVCYAFVVSEAVALCAQVLWVRNALSALSERFQPQGAPILP